MRPLSEIATSAETITAGRREQTGIAKLGGKWRTRTGVGIRFELVDRPQIVVEDAQLAVVRFTEGDDSRHVFGNHTVPHDFVAVESRGPNAMRFPIATDVIALQFFEAAAVVNIAADDAAGLAVREGEIRRDQRCRPALPSG